MNMPTLRILSLGAGVQSTALAILAARGEFEPLDAAIFADTGWEPAAVYEHLDRLEREVLAPARIPLHRVSAGNIRDDALDPDHRYASMPLFVKNPDGSDGMGRRQCTSEYKLKPLHRQVRELLGAPPREDGVPGRVPKGRWAEQWIGISADEAHRALDSKSNQYAVSRWPLLERRLSRSDCQAVNDAAGFFDVAKSACIGCPYHGNKQWRNLRDTCTCGHHRDSHQQGRWACRIYIDGKLCDCTFFTASEWDDAVAFDHAIRNGSARSNARGQALRGQNFLHRSRVPLDQAPIERITRGEVNAAQGDVLAELSAMGIAAAWDDEDAEIVGCGPHACRLPGDPAEDDEEVTREAAEEADEAQEVTQRVAAPAGAAAATREEAAA